MDSLYKSSDRYNFIQRLKNNMGDYVVAIGIVNFKSINDKFGFLSGDKLLTEIVEYTRTLSKDTVKIDVCRYESDIIMLRLKSEEDINISEIVDNITNNKYKYEVTFRVGYKKIDNITKLYNFLDSILYVIKDDKYTLDRKLDQSFEFSYDIERYYAIKKAIMNNDSKNFDLVYQPKIATKDKSIYSCEILSRWSHPKIGESNPDEFIYIIKSLEKEVDFDLMIFEKACKELSNQKIITKFSINVSMKSISNISYVDKIDKIINKYNIECRNITLEILEDTCDYDNEIISNNVDRLINLGINFSIDDFGTGYSSYFRIAELKFSEVKISKEFLALGNEEVNNKNNKVLSSIVTMCRKLNCKIVIEGVETEENIKVAEKLNIDYLQGYYYSKPLEKKQYVKFIESYNRKIAI